MKEKERNPLRVIELFAGIGSQAKALKNLKIPFIHHRVVEFDKYAIKSYNAIHNTNFETCDITQISGKDLGIIDTDKNDYLLTYSFPCQDLSIAGKLKGMAREDSTRSGLLWEVERLLKEVDELPQYLLMENVPNVIGKKNIGDFNEWLSFLERLGYKNFYKILNAKDYGIPQNRKRCFMISILKSKKQIYEFPKPIPLTLKLADMLEDEVNEKYFLSDTQLERAIDTTYESGNSGLKILIPEKTKRGYAEAEEGDGVYINRPHQKRGVVQKGMIQTLKTSGNDVGVVVRGNYRNCGSSTSAGGRVVKTNLGIRRLTPKECWRLMGFSDDDFNKASKVNSNTQLYKQAGNSIVVSVLENIFKKLFNEK